MGGRSFRRLVLVAPAVAAAVVACGGGGAQRGAGRPAVAPAPIAPPAVTDLRTAGAKAIAIRGRWLSAGAGAIWLSGRRAVYRLDGATGRRVATIGVRERPCEATTIAFGFVWTATCGARGLARIDPGANRVDRHVGLAVPRELGGEAAVGAGAGAVWLVVDGQGCTACRVARVAPGSMRVVGRIPVMAGAAGVRVADGAVWVTNPDNDLVQRIDPRRGRVVATVPTGDMPRFVAADRSGVWTLNQADGTTTRIDPRTDRTATADIEVHGSGGALAAHGRWLWARGSEALLTRVDPRTAQVVERYGPAVGSGGVVVGFSAVWVSAPGIDTLWRLPLDRVAGESPAT
jgi:virginiamycin B lyase